jgi:hypothetical protein
MTALERYVRLEALGLLRETADGPPREVVVSLGKATLLLRDLDERPLGHWALAGVVRLRADGPAAVYSMTADGAETLTIGDRDMVEAIAALARPSLAPVRRRRLPLLPLVALAAVAALAVAAVRIVPAEAARLVPPARAAELGDRLLALLAERGGVAPCADPEALRALDAVLARLAPDAPPRPLLVPLGAGRAALLPGNGLVLDPGLVRGSPPEAVAGWAALALGRDPTADLLTAAGPVAALRLLTGRDPGDPALARAADRLAAPPDLGRAGDAVARLAAARIDPAPFAAALPAAPPLPAVDPLPLLDDRQRAALADACR